MTTMYESPSEEGDIGPFVSKEILRFKYKLCLLKSCFFLLFAFNVGMVLFNWHVMQSLHKTLIQIGAFGK